MCDLGISEPSLTSMFSTIPMLAVFDDLRVHLGSVLFYFNWFSIKNLILISLIISFIFNTFHNTIPPMRLGPEASGSSFTASIVLCIYLSKTLYHRCLVPIQPGIKS